MTFYVTVTGKDRKRHIMEKCEEIRHAKRVAIAMECEPGSTIEIWSGNWREIEFVAD